MRAEAAAEAEAAAVAEEAAKEQGVSVTQSLSLNFLQKALKDGMAQKKITVQKYRMLFSILQTRTSHETDTHTYRYWINNLVGNDCHRFLQHIEELLHLVASAML